MAAAEQLARHGLHITLLEARERIGGRIHTIPSKSGGFPIELGAEFVHGAKNSVWDFVSAAGLKTQEVPDRHWIFSEGGLKEQNNSFEELGKVFSAISLDEPDRNFQSFLDECKDLDPTTKTMSLDYVEGFHAADPQRVSIHSLKRSEQASEHDEGDRQFRVSKGYQAMLDWLGSQLLRAGVKARLQTIVEAINWRPGSVEVQARTNDGGEIFAAPYVLITLPLGVMQKQGRGGVLLNPPLAEKDEAVGGLAMGPVVKLILEFRSPFWRIQNFGFIHALGRTFPTWWSDERGAVLTAWAGGPRAKELEGLSYDEVQSQAIRCLAEMFKTELYRIQKELIAIHRHDWTQDPFSCGAYSYTPVGMTHMSSILAAPVAGTLFFAGEATDSTGEQGTVHGALESGRRAAKEIIEALAATSRQHVPKAA